MTDVVLYSALFMVALYTLYRMDPEHSEGKYTSMWSFYRSIIWDNKKGMMHHN